MDKTEYIDEMIAKVLADEATGQERQMLNTWLGECYENKEYFNAIREIWYNANTPFKPEDIDINKAEQHFWNKVEAKSTKKINLFFYWQRIAAIVVFPLFFLTTYFMYKDKINTPIEVLQEAKVPFGGQIKVLLSDGSEVWLNSGSKLTYPSNFLTKDRNVFLEGEGYFKVKADKEHPFIVKTQNLDVRAVGTEFNVEAFATDSLISVSMMEGDVVVTLKDQKQKTMQKGERLVVNHLTGKFDFIKTDTYKWCSWKDGVLLFRDDRLDYVFKRISQIYNVDIELQDTTIAPHLYRATFKEESLEQILNLLYLSAPISFEYSYSDVKGDENHKTKIKVRREE